MRVSTAYIFDQNLSAMLNKQAELGQTQLQVSTGNRILNPSDDPAGSVQILNLQREVSLSEQYLANGTKAEHKQASEEGVLDSATSMLQRIRELAVQGLNSTNTQADKQAIGIEVKQLNEQLLALANTRDSNGDYLFSGFKSTIQPYETINSDYQGDEGQRNIKVGEGVLIETNDPGNHVFEAPLISTTTTTTLMPAVTSTLDAASTATLSVTSYTGGSATFPAIDVAYSAGSNEYVIDDGVNPPTTIAYTDPMTVDLATLDPNFPSMTLSLSGTPVDADAFSVSTGTGRGQANITVDSGAGETFLPISFTYHEALVGPPSTPAQYEISDGSNTETVDYIDGMSVDLSKLNPNFTSLTVKLTGAPAEGDAMVIERAETQVSQSMFKTIENFSNALIANNVGSNDSPNNGDFLTNISASLGVVIDTRAKVGSRLNSIDQQNQINEGISIGMQKALSEIKDLDYAEAISRLSLQMTGLQAAQQSFAKVQGLSLFNYL
jgi:flagellar hook-associated protein 3 FlgL